MVVFLFLVVLLRKSFLHWISRSNHLLRSLLQGISMTLSGNLDISLEGSLKDTFLLQAGVCLLAPRDLLLGILFFLLVNHCHRNENNQLLLGIRRATRPQTVMPSSVLSSDSMHIGLLAAAAHAAATNSCFTVFYNPRASPSEFVIPLSKYIKAVFHTRVSVGMRFRMLFETEE
ncbi:hypothetical protein Goari_006031, partial [Gossypium aridum]|nr:hypothetical protein [Gossypium aridum]